MKASALAAIAVAMFATTASTVAAFRPVSFDTSPAASPAANKRSGSVPVLTPWPEAFSVGFAASVIENGIIGAPSYLFYDWSQTAQRIDFGLCDANLVLAPCSVIFNATGAFLIQNGKCCQTATVGTLPPTWVSNLVYNSTMTAYGQEVNYFRGGTPTHDYFNGIEFDSPVFLLVEDIYEMWQFNGPWTVGPQDPALFLIPPNCAASC